MCCWGWAWVSKGQGGERVKGLCVKLALFFKEGPWHRQHLYLGALAQGPVKEGGVREMKTGGRCFQGHLGKDASNQKGSVGRNGEEESSAEIPGALVWWDSNASRMSLS